MSSSNVNIGKTVDGQPLQLDITRLVDTKMLVTANSGGGKSWMLRLIAEQAAPFVQTIILDPEGEFVTLREKVDCVLVGKDGEIPADPRSAGLLARRLLELNVSAVVDLYDLKLPMRRQFVRLFLEALIDLPKTLWHPLIVVLDESHIFCPEKSAGESESTNAVISLMSLGRKRGFCGVLATQRLSKLHKDAAAEANNVLVGRTTLDIDQKRAAETMGISHSERNILRDLSEGEFYAFGPAISANGVVKFRSAKVSTTHPKAGARHTMQAPRPSKAIQKVVGELSDLPKQAEAEVKGLNEALNKIRVLEKQLHSKVSPPADKTEIDRAVQAALAKVNREWQSRLGSIAKEATKRFSRIRDLAGDDWGRLLEESMPKDSQTIAEPVRSDQVQKPDPSPRRVVLDRQHNELQKAERKILIALYWTKDDATVDPAKIGFYAGYSHGSGSFKNSMSELRNKHGFVAGWQLTEAGIETASKIAEPKPRGAELREWLRPKLDKAENEILDVLIAEVGGKLKAEDIASRTESRYSFTSGSFKNAMSTLRRIEAAVGYDRDGGTMANEVFFE